MKWCEYHSVKVSEADYDSEYTITIGKIELDFNENELDGKSRKFNIKTKNVINEETITYMNIKSFCDEENIDIAGFNETKDEDVYENIFE